jgi:hypothetical protein
MKVHSVLLAQCVESTGRNTNVRRLVPTHPRSMVRERVVLDGPFTESKESCLHVAILARLLKPAARAL